MSIVTTCPCGTKNPYTACCGRFIDGDQNAPTAETLMRSRYTAYTMVRVDYITDTHDPKSRASHDPEQAKKWAEESEWLGLDILSMDAGGPDDERGTVEFMARFRQDGIDHEHRERADFVKRDGGWYFTDGKVLGPKTIRSEGPKIGRNDPCPCGSGKKYKKCCGRG